MHNTETRMQVIAISAQNDHAALQHLACNPSWDCMANV